MLSLFPCLPLQSLVLYTHRMHIFAPSASPTTTSTILRTACPKRSLSLSFPPRTVSLQFRFARHCTCHFPRLIAKCTLLLSTEKPKERRHGPEKSALRRTVRLEPVPGFCLSVACLMPRPYTARIRFQPSYLPSLKIALAPLLPPVIVLSHSFRLLLRRWMSPKRRTMGRPGRKRS